MSRRLVVTMLILAVIITVGGFVAADESAVQAWDMFEIESDSNLSTEYHTVSPDLGLFANTQDAKIQAHYELLVLNEKVHGADTGEESDIVNAYLDHLDAELDELAQRERAAHGANRNGDISDAALVRELINIDATARARQATLDRLPEIGGHLTGPGVVTNYRQQYDMHGGQIRQQLALGLTAADHGQPALVEISDRGVVLAGIDAGQFHREAVRYDRFRLDGEDHVRELSQAEAVVSRTYGNEIDATTIRRPATNLYFVQWSNPSGTTTAYVSGATDAVFLERQQRWTDLISPVSTQEVNESGIHLRVDRTVPTGPVRVSTLDQETSDPVEALVEVRIDDGEWIEVGHTDSSGEFWLVEPRADVDLRIITDRGMVELQLT